jgi:hypothetical protein
MFSRIAATLARAAAAGASVMSPLAFMHRLIRSFSSRFQQMQFEAAFKPRKQRYSMRYPYSSKRAQRRGWLQDAHQNQQNSHKPGTVQPRHIFGT